MCMEQACRSRPGLGLNGLARDGHAVVVAYFEYPAIRRAAGGTFNADPEFKQFAAGNGTGHVPDDDTANMDPVRHAETAKPGSQSGARLRGRMGTGNRAVHMPLAEPVFTEPANGLTAGIKTRNRLSLHVDDLLLAVAA